jgi:hypothetical protein
VAALARRRVDRPLHALRAVGRALAAPVRRRGGVRAGWRPTGSALPSSLALAAAVLALGLRS